MNFRYAPNGYKRKIESDEFLWRYLDMHRFLNLLFTKKLHFSRMDLSTDKMEGVTYEQLRTINYLLNNIFTFNKRITSDKEISYVIERRIPQIESINKLLSGFQKKYYLSCWYVSKRESFGMWNLYSNPDSVCIKVSRDEISQTLNKVENLDSNILDFEKLYHGFVRYKDFTLKYTTASRFKQQFSSLRKDTSFEHELEYRFVIRLKEENEKALGINYPLIDFENMNLKIICHPKMEDWKYENIKKIRNELKFNFYVLKSELFV
ncbi:MAG: hypothetical protein K8S16_00730 [Bacteroidales bacterium]|nr:hypothetical protein [Bacteroidales bacterium]